MNITMIAVGTRGDIQPAIAFGKGLQQQGHHVRILASTNFHNWIEQHGLESAAASVNIQELMASEGGIEWVEKGHNPLVQGRLMKRLLDQFGWDLVWDAWQACQGADAVISSFTSDVYVNAIAKKLNIPQISMPLQPALIPTKDGRSVMNGPFPNRISIINRWFSQAIIAPYPWQMLGDLTMRLREELGLPPQTPQQNKAQRQAMLTMLAYSKHVVPHPADWPPNVHTTGYWFLDEQPNWQPPAALQAFLDAGTPPVYIGFGSMTSHNADATTRLILDALKLGKHRAIVGAGWAGLGNETLPDNIFQIDSVPHSWLFPHMAAVVHHGGAGTTAAGLRAGVPSFHHPALY